MRLRSRIARLYHRYRYRWYLKRLDHSRNILKRLEQLLRFSDDLHFRRLSYKQRIRAQFTTRSRHIDELLEDTDLLTRSIESRIYRLDDLRANKEDDKQQDLDRFLVNRNSQPIYEDELGDIFEYHLKNLIEKLRKLESEDTVHYNYYFRASTYILQDWQALLRQVIELELESSP